MDVVVELQFPLGRHLLDVRAAQNHFVREATERQHWDVTTTDWEVTTTEWRQTDSTGRLPPQSGDRQTALGGYHHRVEADRQHWEVTTTEWRQTGSTGRLPPQSGGRQTASLGP